MKHSIHHQWSDTCVDQHHCTEEGDLLLRQLQRTQVVGKFEDCGDQITTGCERGNQSEHKKKTKKQTVQPTGSLRWRSTQRLEDFYSGKLPVEEDRVVVCVEEATHPDQDHLHGACETEDSQLTEDTLVFLSPAGILTRLEQGDLVVLAENAETWDAFCKLHHVLHGIRQSSGTVLPHLILWLREEEDQIY